MTERFIISYLVEKKEIVTAASPENAAAYARNKATREGAKVLQVIPETARLPSPAAA
jgi:hypothetical protein